MLALLIAVVSTVLVSGQGNQRRYYPPHNRRIYDYVDNKYYNVKTCLHYK